MKKRILYCLLAAFIAFGVATALLLVAGILFSVNVNGYIPFAMAGLIVFGFAWTEYDGHLFMEDILR